MPFHTTNCRLARFLAIFENWFVNIVYCVCNCIHNGKKVAVGRLAEH